eukprot:4309496-Ditylum_brightwellii.AAC.1
MTVPHAYFTLHFIASALKPQPHRSRSIVSSTQQHNRCFLVLEAHNSCSNGALSCRRHYTTHSNHLPHVNYAIDMSSNSAM